MTASFRYDSSWEQFEESVKILKRLISQKQAYWMIGFMKDLDIYIDESVEETLQEDVLNIIHEEILYLLYALLEMGDVSEDDIKGALIETKRGSEGKVQEIVTSVRNKFELVKDAFEVDKLAMRYALKKETVIAKIFDFGYNIFKTQLSEGERAECAIINISSKKKLRSMKGNPLNDFMQNQVQENEVSFLCDREDLDLLIHQLETVRRKMEE